MSGKKKTKLLFKKNVYRENESPKALQHSESKVKAQLKVGWNRIGIKAESKRIRSGREKRGEERRKEKRREKRENRREERREKKEGRKRKERRAKRQERREKTEERR